MDPPLPSQPFLGAVAGPVVPLGAVPTSVVTPVTPPGVTRTAGTSRTTRTHREYPSVGWGGGVLGGSEPLKAGCQRGLAPCPEAVVTGRGTWPWRGTAVTRHIAWMSPRRLEEEVTVLPARRWSRSSVAHPGLSPGPFFQAVTSVFLPSGPPRLSWNAGRPWTARKNPARLCSVPLCCCRLVWLCPLSPCPRREQPQHSCLSLSTPSPSRHSLSFIPRQDPGFDRPRLRELVLALATCRVPSARQDLARLRGSRSARDTSVTCHSFSDGHQGQSWWGP